MKNKAIVISRIKSKKLKKCLEGVYQTIEYLSAEDYLGRKKIDTNSCDIIIATNPYVKKTNSREISLKIKHKGFGKVFYLNTYYNENLDHYQYLKKEECKIYEKHLPIISLNIPFILENHKELSLLLQRVQKQYYMPYIMLDDLIVSLQGNVNVISRIKFAQGKRKSLNLFSRGLQLFFWQNTFVKKRFINSCFKLSEKLLFLSLNSISSCFLIHKKDIEFEEN